MKAVAGALMAALVLTGCSGGGETPPVAKSSASVAAEPTPEPSPSFNYCEDFGEIGKLVKAIRKGTETLDEVLAQANEFQVAVQTQAETESDSGDRKALNNIADSLGELTVSLDMAGKSYPYDKTVQLRRETVSNYLLSAALVMVC